MIITRILSILNVFFNFEPCIFTLQILDCTNIPNLCLAIFKKQPKASLGYTKPLILRKGTEYNSQIINLIKYWEKLTCQAEEMLVGNLEMYHSTKNWSLRCLPWAQSENEDRIFLYKLRSVKMTEVQNGWRSYIKNGQ